MNNSGQILIGTSGYAYEHWRNIFYPEDLSRNEWLVYYSQHFNTVELNVTFYNLPKKDSFVHWHDMTPNEFKFAIKGPRQITHFQKLTNISESIDLFYDHISPLQKKLGAILWQFPPNFKIDQERFSQFIDMLKKFPRARYAFEFRDKSWFDGEIYRMLAGLNAAIVICDWPYNLAAEGQSGITEIENRELITVPLTANFIYLRRHGAAQLYSSLYDEIELQDDAISIDSWTKQGFDVYEYFNNDAEGNAVKNALELQELVK